MIPGWTCTTAAAALRRREVSSRELVEQCLERIERFEPSVRAWVMIDADGARRLADERDDELARGVDRGPLHGLPLGMKDIIDVAGWPTLAGSPLRAGHVADRDAVQVARLRAAGAIFLGKTVTTEWASFDPPPTRNPWNLKCTPGGSSSGSAAGVATGMCLAATATQTGGSVTRPASYCGVPSLKVAYGAIDLAGVVPLSPILDHGGAMARSIDDLAMLYEIMSGAKLSPPSHATSVAPTILQADSDHWPTTATAVRAAITRALLAADIGPLSLTPLPAGRLNLHAMHRRLMARGAAEVHRDEFPRLREKFGPCIAALMDEGLLVTDEQWIEALVHRQQFEADMLRLLDSCDALLMPATLTTAPGAETTGDPYFNSPISHAHVPALSLPCAVADDGLPVAVQLVGHPARMDRLFATARWCEERFDFQAQPQLLTT